MYFESHAHYDDERYSEDREEVINSLKENDIDYVINIGCDMKSSKKSMDLSDKHDFIYCTVGVHPHSVKDMEDKDIEKLKEYLKEKKVVAVGEIGLDYYYDNSPRDIQKYWFKKQLKLCIETGKPAVIHSREATAETLEIIKESGVKKGVVHCYSGSAEVAKEYVKMGVFIGVGGVVTYKNAKVLVEVVEKTPIENILIETDSPYLAPHPMRGQRNNSIYLKYITEKIAKIKKILPEEVARITSENAKILFLRHI